MVTGMEQDEATTNAGSLALDWASLGNWVRSRAMSAALEQWVGSMDESAPETFEATAVNRT